MTANFADLPTDIVRLVLQMLDILDLARLDTAMCDTARFSSLLTALDGLLFDVSHIQTMETLVNPDARRWFQSRGLVLNQVFYINSSTCFSILQHPNDRPLKLRTTKILTDIELTQSQWDQLWTQLRVSELMLQSLSQLDYYERTPHLHTCILEATLSLSSITPKQLLSFLGRTKATLKSIRLNSCAYSNNPLPEWNDYQSIDHHEEWPMLTELQISGCYNSCGAMVLALCARGAVSLSDLCINSTCLHSDDGLVALLQHQIWRPRNHILTIDITIFTPFSGHNTNHMSVLDLPQSWRNDNPPITLWEVSAFQSDASKLGSFVDLIALLPQPQQRVSDVFLELNTKGFPLNLPRPAYNQTLRSIVPDVGENTTVDMGAGFTEMDWKLLLQSLCLTSIHFIFHHCNTAFLEYILATLVDMAANHSVPPLEDVELEFPSSNNDGSGVPSFTGQIATKFLSTLATSCATSLVYFHVTDVAVSNVDVITFLTNCRSLRTFHIEDIHVFNPLSATTLPHSNEIAKQPRPKLRNITIGVRMPDDSTHHEVVWNSIRCIANHWNQHCSAYRDPTPRELAVLIKSLGHHITSTINSGYEVLVDMPYVKLSAWKVQ